MAELPAITTEIITNVFFTTNIVVTTSNLYYLPEQDISGIQTLNPYGLWKLEILDNRAGGGLTNSLVSWQMEFQYANTNITELPVLPTLATNYSVIETTLFTVTNTATYSVSNATLIYTVTGATNASISTNGIITWTPTESQGPGTFFLVTTVRDAANPLVVSQNFFQVDVLESNLPPVLTFPTTNTVFRILETVPWTTNATATDLDIPTNTLTFALVGMTNSFGVSVTGLSITPDGIINWQPVETNGPSTNFVFITVTDFNANNPVNTNSFTVTNSFTIIVLESNLPPVLILPPNTNLVELVSWTAQATAVDNDWPTNQLTFTLASGPSGLAVSPSGLIAWTPNELQGPGDYIVAISVTDTNPWAINQQSFTVSGTFIIHVDEWNIAPTLPTLPDTNTFELQTLTVNNAATDPDAPFNTLTYTLLVSPLDTNAPPVTNAFISVNGIITWIPTEAQGPGDYLFTTIVTDTNPPAINSTSFSATNSFIVHVLETNSAPFWVTNYPAVVMDELTVTNIFATALDTDLPPNILTYSLATNTPPWVTINSSNGLITLAPGEAAGPSTNTFTAIVTDNGAPPLSATTNFTVIVNEVNTAPFWATNVPSQTNYVVFEQTLLTVTNTASDADIPTNGLTYVLSVVSTNLGAPAVTNAAIDTNGVITWMPTEAQGPGIYIFTTIVTDTNPWALINQSFSATNYFTVTVLETNSAPFWVTNYPAVVMDELTVTNIAATALDADLPTNTLTFTLATNTPIWVSINPTNGLITLAPGEADGPSTNTFTVIVTDDGVPALNATTNFTVIVNEVNTAPFWTNAYPNVVLNTLDVTNVFGSATDTDLPPNTLTYSLSNAPAFVSINPGSGVITLTPGLSDGPSSNTVTVIVTDNGVPPLSAVTNFTVIVNSSIITLGGSNDARGVGIKYLNGSVYICGDSTATGGFLADFSLPLTANQTPLWNTNWPSANPNDALNAITASTNGVYAAGPNYTRTTDSAGGKEVKGLVVKYPLGGSIGGGFGGDLWDRQTPAAPGAFSYGGGEGLNGITLASENGINYLYACGNSQSGGANGGRFYLSKLAEDSTVLWTQTDGAEQVGVQFSAGEAVTVLNTNLYAAGVLNGQPYLRQYTPTGALIWKRTHTLAGAYLGITAAANYLYAVGYANVAGTNTDFLIDKWDEAGNLVWSRTYDRNTAQDQLNAAVNFNDRIFAVGYTYGQTAGGADAVILEIDPLTGSLLTTNLVGGSRDDKANGVDTDRTNLYVIGETRSFNNGTNQAMLFTFTPQLPTLVIGTPVTNIVAPGSINWYQVNVPTNAIAASNALLFATLPVNLWYSTNVPPSIFGPGAAELLTNSTGGTNVIATVNTFPLLVPGGIYFLGVQNTNSLAVTNAIQVTFAYEPPTLVIDDPVTNVVAPGSINWFRVNVPTNADFATNFLLFATAPVNLWYSSNTPPSITGISDFEMLANSTSGLYVMNTNTAPLLVPGSHYYLGVQNTNNFAVTNAIKVKFHLRTAAPPVPPSYTIYSIVQTTNAAGTNGFLLTWFAPTNTQFHLQWTPQLVPINWKEFKGVISFDSYISATNSHFSYFDDGDTNRGSAPFGFSRFYRLHLLNSPTNTAPEFSLAPTNYNVDSSVAFVVTNTARDWDLPAQTLFYRVTNSLSGTNYTTITNGVITWTPDVTQSGLTNFITTIVADSGTPTQRATNVVAVVVRAVPMFSAITIATNGVSLRWNAPTNQQFNVRWTTNLVPVIAWTLFPNTITSLTGTFTFTDTNAPFAMKFYQLILLP